MLKSQSVHDADTFYITSARSALNRTREKQLKHINNSLFRGYVMLFRSSARDLLPVSSYWVFFFFFFFMVKCSTNKQELCTTVDFSIHLEFHLKNSTITLSKCLSHYLNACKLNRCFFPKETHGSKTKRTGQPVLLQ